MHTSTVAAYQNDVRRFLNWGGAIPASDRVVADYFRAHANSHKLATLKRWQVSLSKAHADKGMDDPTRSEPVDTEFRMIEQQHGRNQRSVAQLTPKQAKELLKKMGDRLIDVRDRALFLVAMSGGLSRSEIIALTVDRVRVNGEVMMVTTHTGRAVSIRLGEESFCAVRALTRWLADAGIMRGAVFQRVNRHGGLSGVPLTGHGVALVIKKRVASIGLDPALYSACSLRKAGAGSAHALQ